MSAHRSQTEGHRLQASEQLLENSTHQTMQGVEHIQAVTGVRAKPDNALRIKSPCGIAIPAIVPVARVAWPELSLRLRLG